MSSPQGRDSQPWRPRGWGGESSGEVGMDGRPGGGAGRPRRWDHAKELALQWGAQGHFEQGRDLPRLLLLFQYFIFYLAAPCLIMARGILSCGMHTLSCVMRAVSCSMWGLVPRPGIEPSPPPLGNEESELVGHLGSALPRLFICICIYIISIHTHAYLASFYPSALWEKGREGRKREARRTA